MRDVGYLKWATCLAAVFLVSSGRLATAELVGYWSFDDQSFDDLSGNDNHGQMVNVVEFSDDTPNGSGYSISFLADNGRVDVPHSDSLDLNDVLTIAYWIKAPDVGTAAWAGPLSKSTGEPEPVGNSSVSTSSRDWTSASTRMGPRIQ